MRITRDSFQEKSSGFNIMAYICKQSCEAYFKH